MGTLAWRRTGHPTNAPLLLLHAMPLDGSMWNRMRALMPDVDVLTVDAPGFGKSPAGLDLAKDFPHPELGEAGKASVAVYVDALKATLDELGITEVAIGGVSMGGGVAAAFTNAYPQMVLGLAVIDSKIGAEPAEGYASRQRMIDLCDAGHAYDTIKDWTTTLVSPAASDELRAELDAKFRAVPDAGLAWLQRAQLTREDNRSAVEKVDGPVLLMRGKDDPTCSRATLQELCVRARDTRIVEIVQAGHFSPYEKPEPCSRLLADFWYSARQ